ncbi:MAG TPA: tRNA (adenosine(37)-N6)-threonylcarbamoyltransferase complex dimerization subunit type 1 TsaB [Pseudogracilibacillus sp.]|nr:tRNA (adenosine(37)-N6)-threonylcarbamoyltransferase complex dimerization subunit type 1 TsaB [Pseudogracilibacillus sp.]
MNMLAIDTSTQILGVALMKNDIVVAEMTTNLKKDHSSRLMPVLNQLMQQADMKPEDLHKIVVAHGPGSYTGTRIGVTTAKTLAWTLDIPIIPVSSLKALGYNAAPYQGYVCPFFDARREAVFTGLYHFSAGVFSLVKEDRHIKMEEWTTELNTLQKPILFLSPDFAKHQACLNESGLARVHAPDSSHLLRPSNLLMLAETEPAVPAHEVTPNYLRVTEAEANWKKRQKEEKNNG